MGACKENKKEQKVRKASPPDCERLENSGHVIAKLGSSAQCLELTRSMGTASLSNPSFTLF